MANFGIIKATVSGSASAHKYTTNLKSLFYVVNIHIYYFYGPNFGPFILEIKFYKSLTAFMILTM